MGAAISEILNGKSAEDERKANDALNSLVQLANMRHESFMNRIKAGQVDTNLIPIKKIITNQHIIKCSVTTDAKALGEQIGKILGNFATGDIVQGITDLSVNVLDLLFGNFSANQSEYTGYVISLGANGAIFRIDTDFYAYQYTSDDLSAICKNVVTSAVVISSADTSTIDKNTLRVIIAQVFGSLPIDEQTKIFDQIWASIQEDKESLHFKRINGLAEPYGELDLSYGYLP